MREARREKSTPSERAQQVLDGCTRAKYAAVKLTKLGAHVQRVSIQGKNPQIVIDPPPKTIAEFLNGETVSRWLGAGGRTMVTFTSLFELCRVEWTQPEGI